MSKQAPIGVGPPRGTRGSEPSGRLSRGLARVGGVGIRGLTAATDAVPPRIRFGHWQRVLRMLAVRQDLPVLTHDGEKERPPLAAGHASATDPVARCLIVAGSLDAGGIESVVATLALGLPAHGLAIDVACSEGGRVADSLVEAGVHVLVASTEALPDLIAERAPDVVQLHRIDPHLLSTLAATGVPTVCVFHAMETYLGPALLQQLTDFVGSTPSIAVSGSVRRFFAESCGLRDIRVVVNGVDAADFGPSIDRSMARRSLGLTLGCEIAPDDVLVVSLQRYSDQKNSAGLVDAFLRASESEPRLRLALAGRPDNWLEVRRADMVRRSHRHGARVHLLGDSDAATLLAAGDLFALDSFAEGGPVSALEAVAAGLPVVLSDVGFARELVQADRRLGLVVPRANEAMSTRAIARQRRRRHQSNREPFAQALLQVARQPRCGIELPDRFSQSGMLAGHAQVLLEVACPASDRRGT